MTCSTCRHLSMVELWKTAPRQLLDGLDDATLHKKVSYCAELRRRIRFPDEEGGPVCRYYRWNGRPGP